MVVGISRLCWEVRGRGRHKEAAKRPLHRTRAMASARVEAANGVLTLAAVANMKPAKGLRTGTSTPALPGRRRPCSWHETGTASTQRRSRC